MAGAPRRVTRALLLEIPVTAVMASHVVSHLVTHAHVRRRHVAHLVMHVVRSVVHVVRSVVHVVRSVVHHSAHVATHSHLMGHTGVAVAPMVVLHRSHMHLGHPDDLTERGDVWPGAVSSTASTRAKGRHHRHSAHTRSKATSATHSTGPEAHVRV